MGIEEGDEIDDFSIDSQSSDDDHVEVNLSRSLTNLGFQKPNASISTDATKRTEENNFLDLLMKQNSVKGETPPAPTLESPIFSRTSKKSKKNDQTPVLEEIVKSKNQKSSFSLSPLSPLSASDVPDIDDDSFMDSGLANAPIDSELFTNKRRQ